MADPLAEAMSMLDAVTNGESFEDFAIDSDDDENLQELDLGNDILDEALATKNGAESAVVSSESAAVGGSVANAKTASSVNELEHPLQMTGAGDADPLSQMNLSGTVNNNNIGTNKTAKALSGIGAGVVSNAGGENVIVDATFFTSNAHTVG